MRLTHALTLLAILVTISQADIEEEVQKERFSKTRHLVTNKNTDNQISRPLFSWDSPQNVTAPLHNNTTTKNYKIERRKNTRRSNNKRRLNQEKNKHRKKKNKRKQKKKQRNIKQDTSVSKYTEELHKNADNIILPNYIPGSYIRRSNNEFSDLEDHLNSMLNSIKQEAAHHSQTKGKCACQHICRGRMCQCYPGYYLDKDGKSCIDVNECLTLNGGCDHVCENLPGSHRCSCRRGWRLGTHPGSCEDVNECLLNNGHGPCAHACVNTPGGHKCTCEGLPGTRLAPDGRRCLLTHQKLDCQELAGCSHSCLLVRAGTSVFCTCPDGLQLGTDWKTCQDINECSFPEISQSCPHCQNTFGSYHCTKTLPELAELNLPPSSIQSHPTVQAHVISPHQSLETNSHINQSNPLHDPHSFPLDQSIPDHVVCPPLFPPRHGFIECERGNAAPVNWKAPSGRKRITNRPGSICELTCPVGYKKHGRWKKICGKNGLWEGEDTGKCEQYPPPMIKCANPIVNRLKSGESHLKIQIPPPVSSLEPKYIRSEPILRNLTLTAPRGQHWVHFTARHPITGLTAKCTVFVVVKGAPGT